MAGKKRFDQGKGKCAALTTSRGQSSTSQDAEVTGVSDYLRRLSETVPDMVYAVFILSFTWSTHTQRFFADDE